MDVSLEIGFLTGSIPVFYFMYVHIKKIEDRKRLEEYLHLEPTNHSTKVLHNFKDRLMNWCKPLLPSHRALEKMQLNLRRANLGYSAEEVYVFRWMVAIVMSILMGLLHLPSVDKMLMFGGTAGGFCYLLPSRLILLKVKHRQLEAEYQVLDFIDLVANGMEAGLDLTTSIDKVTRQMPGVLSEEFQIAFSEIELNRRRAEAFKSLAERLDVEDVTLLVDAINQAERTGVPMARVLKDQAQRIRNNYKTNALKIAQAASVKMLFPMIVFILPALFIVVLGPPFIGIGNLLKF